MSDVSLQNERVPPKNRPRCLEHVAIVGPFQPAAIARMMPEEAASQLAGLKGFAGIPVQWLTGALVGAGIRTTLIGGVRGVESKLIESERLNVSIYKGSGGWPFLLNGRARERREILETLRKARPEIAHAMWTLEGGRAVGDWKGPKLLTVQDAAWEYVRLGWTPNAISTTYGIRWLLNTRETLARYKTVIAVSPYVEAYLRITPRFRGEIRVIPNAILEFPADQVLSEAFPRTDTITFACYGDPGPLKNIKSAIKAFRLLKQRLSGIRLLVFGKWDKDKQAYADDKDVIFMGGLSHREFLRYLAEEIDVWVHPSRIETQGIAFLEAILAGVPVVAGRESGAVPWALDYGRSGLLVDVENPPELADAMHFLASNRKKAMEMVERGRIFIQQNFSSERILELHLEYYRDILNQPSHE
jgi:glycosyltransferase involved in cell wall biosynthesis